MENRKLYLQLTDILNSLEISYTADEDLESIVLYRDKLGNLNSETIATLIVSDSAIVSLCHVDMHLNLEDEEEMDRVAEFLLRANSGLIYGCFSINYDLGCIVFAFTINLKEMQLTKEMVEDLISIPLAHQLKYIPGLERVKYLGEAPKKALEMCEQ